MNELKLFAEKLTKLIEEVERLRQLENEHFKLTYDHKALNKWLKEKHPDVSQEYANKLISDIL